MKSNDWRHKNVARYTPGNTKILYFFNCLLDGMHTTFIPKRRLLTNGKPEFEKKFHLVVDKLRFLGYYKTVMIIITSYK